MPLSNSAKWAQNKIQGLWTKISFIFAKPFICLGIFSQFFPSSTQEVSPPYAINFFVKFSTKIFEPMAEEPIMP